MTDGETVGWQSGRQTHSRSRAALYFEIQRAAKTRVKPQFDVERIDMYVRGKREGVGMNESWGERLLLKL